MSYSGAVLGFTFGGGSGVAIISAGGTDLYCHSEPLLTSGKLCFIINFIGGHKGAKFLLEAAVPCPPPFEPLLVIVRPIIRLTSRDFAIHLSEIIVKRTAASSLTNPWNCESFHLANAPIAVISRRCVRCQEPLVK